VNQDPRRQLIETAIGMTALGINSGTSGNISLRHGEGMLITPTGVDYDDLHPGDIVSVSLEGQWDAGRQPSSEWRFHRDIYCQRPDAQAIIHAHPVYSTALACLRKDIPPFHYMVAVSGGKSIRCAPYATFGTQDLSNHVLKALHGRTVCLVANHGLVCLAGDLPRALALATEVENLARIYCQCLAIGEPVLLDSEEMAQVIEKFKYYGANGMSR
jgi:L-fuculose-phosphate aldolase